MFCTLLATVLAVLSFSYASSTPNQSFTWSFANLSVSAVTTCTSLSIRVENFTDSHAVPPFYMMAFEVGGYTRTTLIGKDFRNLTWLVDHVNGTNLLLNVVDSLGNMGFIPPNLYSVVGDSSHCAKKTPSSSFILTANVTDSLTTCQPWGLHISGGNPPYNLTLAALNSSFVTNTTLGDSDLFTYINRATPEGHLMAAVSDSTGQWATGAALVKTTGSTNISCSGFVSSSGSLAQADQSPTSFASVSISPSLTSTPVPMTATQNLVTGNIVVLSVGVGVGVGALLLLVTASFCIFAYRAKRSRASEITNTLKRPDKGVVARPFTAASMRTVSSVPTIDTTTTGRLRRHREPVLSIISWVAGAISPLSPNSNNRSSPFPVEGDCNQQNENKLRSCVRYAPGGFHLPAHQSELPKQSNPLSSASSSCKSPIATEGEAQDGYYVIRHRDNGAMARE